MIFTQPNPHAGPLPHPQAFPSVSEEELAALLPSKAGLVQTKLSNRCLLYSLDGSNPLFFDPDGRGGLLPTVRCCTIIRASKSCSMFEIPAAGGAHRLSACAHQRVHTSMCTLAGCHQCGP